MDNNLQNEIEKFYDNYQGASDLRSAEEKSRDFNQREIVVSANPVVWVEKKPEDWRTFPELNQQFTSKCVAFTTAKLALINYWLKTKEFLKFSPNSIYNYRSNKPEGGMVGEEAFTIWKDRGISLEAVCKSNQVQETEPIEVSLFATEVAKGFKLGNYITIDNGDFDRVISTIQTTGKGVMVWFYFTSREWSLEIPIVIDNLANEYSTFASRHSVTATDGGLINGIQYMRIEDSAHFGGISVRYITRELFNARNFLSKYPMNFNYEEESLPEKPKFDGTIISLQKCLKWEGLFPINIAEVESYGNITRKAVVDFQKKYGIVPAYGNFGPVTKAKIISLYS